VSCVLDELWADPECRVVTTTREEEAVGLLSGAWLARHRALLMQNSGLGNCTNALSTAPFDQDLIGQATRFRKALAALPAS
jgi:sulfopyruvate decarboxylase TPP-binding subunit